MKLGDLVYYFTFYTGIHWLVKKVSKAIGKDCGCDQRRDEWNDIDLDLWNKQTNYYGNNTRQRQPTKLLNHNLS